ncbi:MAG: MurR/RpiR family transcriptional regulator [Rhodospirillaceae bacterium]|jgi:DNA-binding MurR/RpiR family transcriptional regulator|nr:MurR/RpiR family transcriptional regulator [Rhodospirillaceae bacterium]MBT4219662.1 MurR/RpiR family transcriptional regulator [Rhodospirillaceae bacterium]MBT5013932.1 MurR/RpiR family transcriptional regulator [Rhodospirillaceae bacterium]MBT5308748.1 MurR/RpiR family transcriptional regulator [Rhodospirillaceae bacterium]MBT7355995.1 MurR/RpiR family transcriptional regulator [Rhodospirillaceae bacterium]
MPDSIESFDQLRMRFHEQYEDLSPQLKKIAQFALDDPNRFALEKVVDLSAEMGVQPSALIRFAKSFGYSGFSDLQRVFKLRLIEGAPSFRERIYGKHEQMEGAARDNPASLLRDFAEASNQSLSWLEEDVTDEQLRQAVEIIHKSRNIYVIGQRRAFPVASYLSYGLTRLEYPCQLLDGVGGMAPQQAATMTGDDILIAVSYAEYAKEVVEIVKDVHIRGIPVLAITDNLSSPLATFSKQSFCVRESDVHRFRPLTGSIVLAQTLILTLGYFRDASTPG